MPGPDSDDTEPPAAPPVPKPTPRSEALEAELAMLESLLPPDSRPVAPPPPPPAPPRPERDGGAS